MKEKLKGSFSKLEGNLVLSKYRILKYIGSTNFSDVFYGATTDGKLKVTIKIDKLMKSDSLLKHEHKMYQQLKGMQGIPKVHAFGIENKVYILIMDYIGPNLQYAMRYIDSKQLSPTIFRLATQMLIRIQALHAAGFIHRDIKPENFLLGKDNILYMIDFAFAKRYRDRHSKEHIHFRDGKKFIGTSKFASLNTHLGYEQSRRDDLESLAYTLIYLLKGKLFSQSKTADEITEQKMEDPLEQLCRGTSKSIYKYLAYCRGLMFESTPDYDLLLEDFNKAVDNKTEELINVQRQGLKLESPEVFADLHESHFATGPVLLKYAKQGVAIGPTRLSEKFKMRTRKSQVEKLMAGLPKQLQLLKVSTRKSDPLLPMGEAKSMTSELPKMLRIPSPMTLIYRVSPVHANDSLNNSMSDSTPDLTNTKENSLTLYRADNKTTDVNIDNDIPVERVSSEKIPIFDCVNNWKHWNLNRRWKPSNMEKLSELSKRYSNKFLNSDCDSELNKRKSDSIKTELKPTNHKNIKLRAVSRSFV